MEDITHPDEMNWQIPALIFAKTINLILDENQGIVVNLEQNTKISGHEEVEQVIVYKKNGEIHIAPSEDKFDEGSALNLNISEN
jgi:hypothetical protein